MAFDVRALAAEVASKGYLKTNKFQMNFQVPLGLFNNQVTGLGDLTQTARNIELYGEQAHFPGVMFAADEIRRYGYGPLEKKPFAPIFRDLPMTFREDSNGSVWKFFTKWMRLVLLYETRQAGITGQIGSVPGQYPYEVAYKEDYAQDVSITIFDDAGNAKLSSVMRQAYPIFVGDVAVSWQDKNQLFRVPVVMTFFDMYEESDPPVPPSPPPTG